MIRSATVFNITRMPLLADFVKGQPFQAGGVRVAPYRIRKD